MILQKYDSYQYSGVKWLGEIPEGWGVKRLKDFFNQISESSNELEPETYIPLEKIESFTGKLTKRSSNYNGELINLFKKGDLLFNKLRPYLGKVIECEFDGGVSGEAIVLRTKNSKTLDIFSRYIFYRLLSTKFIFEVNSRTTGVKMPRTNPNVILALEIGYPNKESQTKIAKFLDEKTSQIDSKIKILQEKISSYEDLKKSVINETVCRGLNKNVKLKASEIEWIGNIPKHWDVERGKDRFLYQKTKNKNLICKNVLSLTYNGVINKDYDTTGGLNPESYETYQLVNKDDLIFKLIDLENIKTSRVGIVHEYGIMSSAYIRLLPKGNIFSRYFYYLYFYYYRLNLFNYLGGGVRSTLNYGDLLVIPIINPPKEEQVQIANYLDEKTTKINNIISKIKDQINTLKEFRKTLINDLVTGKVRVSE